MAWYCFETEIGLIDLEILKDSIPVLEIVQF